jgi:hypothetical protein
MEHEHETIKPSAPPAEVDGAGGEAGTAVAAAAATTPAPSRPDPMDAAAIRIITTNALGLAAGVDPFVVPLDVAKRIRDEAVAEVLDEAERALEAMRATRSAQIEQSFAQGAAHAIAQMPPEHIGPCEADKP